MLDRDSLKNTASLMLIQMCADGVDTQLMCADLINTYAFGSDRAFKASCTVIGGEYKLRARM